MKNKFKFSAVIIAGVMLFGSCSSDGNSGSSSSSDRYIHAKVDGANFTTSVGGLQIASATTYPDGISITGNDNTSPYLANNITIFLANDILEPGTYTINDVSGSGLLFTASVNGNPDIEAPHYIAGSHLEGTEPGPCTTETGTITITHIDNVYVAGTFNFIGLDEENSCAQKTITNGEFSVKLNDTGRAQQKK